MESDEFQLECPECAVNKSFEDYSTASDFRDEHEKHTGHKMTWVEDPFDMKTPTMHVYKWSCSTCNDKWEFATQSEAESFKDKHSEVTDHEAAGEIEKEERSLAKEVDGELAIREVVKKLQDRYEEGAPMEMVLAAFDSDRLPQAEDDLQKLLVKGEVYKPQQGYLRTT